MPCEKIKRITRREVSDSCPNNRQKDALKYYKVGHNNGWKLSFIIIVGDIIDVEEGRQFDWWIETRLENKNCEQ